MGYKFLAYLIMSIFDLSVIAGACYLIDQRGWSTSTMVLAFLLCAGSSPNRLFKDKKVNETKTL